MKNNILAALIGILLFIDVFAQNAGWTDLFDGKTLNGWKRLAGTADFAVKDGAIVGTTVFNSGNSFLVTEKEFGDLILEMDVKIDDTTSNSGVQVRSHYDPAGHEGRGLVYGCQFEIDPSSRRWSGGIYDEGRRDWLYPASLNQRAQDAFKVGVYNHIRMECIGHEMKTWINGTAVAYLVDTVDRSGFIGLQVHAVGKQELSGEKVYFKNIRIQTTNLRPTPFPGNIYVVSDIPNTLTDYEKGSGWRLLFDGRTPNGWVGAYKDTFPNIGWRIRDGILTVLGSQGKEGGVGGDIVTTDLYKAFDLSFEFKLTPGANSGVKYFVRLAPEEKTSGSAIGLEYQLLDDSLHPDAKLGRDGDRTLASLYDLITANKQKRFIHPIGQWNTGRIIVYPNNHVEHYLNGVKVLEYERGSAAFRDLVAISKYKVWKNFGEAEQGHLLLQDHGNETSFRSIKIRVLQ
jgi:3-keto-disaccharide hydrolase